MYFIVGLGNPGLQYENTRHNVGFMTIDYLANKYDIDVRKLKFKSLYGQGEISGHKVMLIKPQTYMNNSGEAIRELRNFYKFDIDKLIVIYDDIDIDFGTIRIRKKGSAGSHNGMKSIIYQIQDDQFPRIKISIGQKPERWDLANFVLSGFSKEEVGVLEDEIRLAAEGIELILKEDIDKAMNRCNSVKLVKKDNE
ncbi:aminoacyl-tRNA hydrolase [Anaerococcus degeneri]|uniref:Peptidyl-tRNA hydrolase n=1 Tax=Anaerococcus degeneri TaxID=361500 RepID=A0ABS7YUA7_9FIRM|nr:aminoacyl-tRNA hydrolase [Anaerococcus degeneri]MBP2015056.1 PTH1 family peptidyl-tRNA hydrolase [Anaerococcus degeneri]MCA2095316.1 aminoacyl-tRNA hydrolase [Anaerococcus degeneri]